MKKYYLALDIGGTKTTGALFDRSGNLVEGYTHVAASRTFEGEEAVYQNTRDVLMKVLSHFSVSPRDIAAVGVGSPGPLDVENGIIVHAPLMGWKQFPIVRRLEEDFQVPVFLDNDGNLGALAEHRLGVAKGSRNMIYMTVSTGCGGGIIISNEIYRGFQDGAGEVGHMCIYPEGEACPCGARGCFEMYASGTALNRRARHDMRSGKVDSLAFELAHRCEEKLNGQVLFQAAEKEDVYARNLYEQEGYYLGIGLANLFNLFSPDVFVLGGGVTKAKQFFHESMMSELRKRALCRIRDEQIKYSVMNDKVVLYGAYCMAAEKTERLCDG